MTDRDDLLEFLVRTGALRFGEFTLKSGDLSPFFVNLGDVATGSDLFDLGGWLARGLREHFPGATHLFGPAYKGIVLATAASVAAWTTWQWDLPLCYDRKERKSHGETGVVVGRPPGAGDRVVVVDDVLSSGGTKLGAVRLLRERYGVDPAGVLVVLDRRRATAPEVPELPRVAALADLLDLHAFLVARDPDRAARIRAFHEGTHA